MTDRNITKAIIPVAGLGTRMLPASKAIPKEMLPVVDRPAIQYVVEEAAAAGLTDILLVSQPAKHAIEAHFAQAPQLESQLAAKGKQQLLEAVQSTRPDKVVIETVFQQDPKGLGHAVACGADWVGDDPFAVLLSDVLLDSAHGLPDMAAMVDNFKASGDAQIMVEAVPDEQVPQYGIVAPRSSLEQPGSSASVKAVVEKPSIAEAPSNLAVVGRYIFPASIMPLLQKTPVGKGGEIQLTDAIDALIHHGKVAAWRMTGQTFDCGSKLGYLEAILHFGLAHPELGDGLRAFLAKQEMPDAG